MILAAGGVVWRKNKDKKIEIAIWINNRIKISKVYSKQTK
jgi:hypothetical protein